MIKLVIGYGFVAFALLFNTIKAIRVWKKYGGK